MSAPVEPFEMPPVGGWLNYAGDVRGSLGQLMGPTLERPDQFLTVVAEEYDPETNRTRLGLAYGVHQLPEEARHD